jgi:hypothetical protein
MARQPILKAGTNGYVSSPGGQDFHRLGPEKRVTHNFTAGIYIPRVGIAVPTVSKYLGKFFPEAAWEYVGAKLRPPCEQIRF